MSLVIIVRMELPFRLFVALRYLKSRKRHRSVSLSTLISTGGVALGVMALLIVLAVMSGFHADLQRKILGVNTHLVILDYTGPMADHAGVMQKLKSNPHILDASPFVLGQVMVSYGGRAQGVYIRGVEPGLEINTTEIEKHMVVGSIMKLKDTASARDEYTGEPPMPGIVLGHELSSRLGAVLGDVIKVVSPFSGSGPMGAMPKVKRFRLVGIFEVGMFEYDSNLALVDIGQAQEFFGMGPDVTGIEAKVDDIYNADKIGEDVSRSLGYPYFSKDWIHMNKSLFAALKLEKLAMFVILTLIVLVAAFNIVGTQTMNVIEKERQIAILKAMGATNKAIMSIFMLQGFLIGLVGTLIGLSSGTIVCVLMDKYRIIKLPADVYYLSYLPAKINLADFAAVSISAILISFLATIYPSRQAAKMNPVEPLRYE